MIYDLFYVSQGKAEHWQEFKSRFSNAQLIEDVESLDQIKQKTLGLARQTKATQMIYDVRLGFRLGSGMCLQCVCSEAHETLRV